MQAQLPNILSISRIVLAVLVVLISGHLTVRTYLATVFMVGLALLTDAIDGYLARRWKTTSELGYILDSLGDRALHLALLLVFLVRYQIHPLFVWLLIFRDIGIFAVRVLSKDWLQKSVRLQWISRLQAAILRVWLGLFLARDGFRVFTGSDVLGTPAFETIQIALLCVTIIVSYFGFIQSFGWLIDHDHKTISQNH